MEHFILHTVFLDENQTVYSTFSKINGPFPYKKNPPVSPVNMLWCKSHFCMRNCLEHLGQKVAMSKKSMELIKTEKEHEKKY